MNTAIPQETFASLLRTYREERSLSQGHIAETAGFDRSYISYLERGLRNPTREVVLALARALNLSDQQRNTLLLGARFAAEDAPGVPSIDLNDRVVELVARSINDLPEPRRSAFRDELAAFVRYLRARYDLASTDEIRPPTSTGAPLRRRRRDRGG